MATKKDDLNIDGLQLPNIPIKIVRKGDRLKFSAGGYELELNEMKDMPNQSYPLLLLDKFTTEVTTTLLKKEMEARENRAAAKKSLEMLGVETDDRATDNVIRQIHDGMFPEEQ